MDSSEPWNTRNVRVTIKKVDPWRESEPLFISRKINTQMQSTFLNDSIPRRLNTPDTFAGGGRTSIRNFLKNKTCL
jgi:hypothetical protein